MLEKIWYKRNPTNPLAKLLIPISKIFSKVAINRKIKQQKSQYKSKIPAIVVGNISVGGTGKTPVVRKLAQNYLDKGKKPTIISRGYGAKADNYPFAVTDNTQASQCGDEPAMLYDAFDGKVPIVISPKRIDSVKFIEQYYPDTDVIICDDGLQHYKLARDYEIAVIDTSRMLGNQLCLPAGPLREPVERLKSVDCIIAIGDCRIGDKEFLQIYNHNIIFTKIHPTKFVNLCSKEILNMKDFKNKSVTAIAAIGNPSKFFKTLKDNGLNITNKKIFKDHHKFTAENFKNICDSETVIMTYKDAIKCKNFAKKNWWYLDIDLDNSMVNLFEFAKT